MFHLHNCHYSAIKEKDIGCIWKLDIGVLDFEILNFRIFGI